MSTEGNKIPLNIIMRVMPFSFFSILLNCMSATCGKYYNLRFFYLHSECFGNCHHFLASVSQFRRGLSSCCTDVSYVVVASKHQGFRHQPAFRLELCGSCTDTSVTTALFFVLVLFPSYLFITLFYCLLS